VLPKPQGGRDIPLLPLLRTSTEQDDELLPISSEVDSIAGPVMDPMFENSFTHSLVVTEIALSHSTKRDHHPIRATSR
jgi:hypothetical protein